MACSAFEDQLESMAVLKCPFACSLHEQTRSAVSEFLLQWQATGNACLRVPFWQKGKGLAQYRKCSTGQALHC